MDYMSSRSKRATEDPPNAPTRTSSNPSPDVGQFSPISAQPLANPEPADAGSALRAHFSDLTAEPHSAKAYARVVHRSAMPGSLGVRAIGERDRAKFVLREYQWLNLRHGPHARRDVHLQECGRPAAPARK